jgi:uncharacterized protein YdhG (YjbR/CyaY superfamily)
MNESEVYATVFKILHAIQKVSKNMQIFTNQGNEMINFSAKASEANTAPSTKAFKSFSLVCSKGTKILTQVLFLITLLTKI